MSTTTQQVNVTPTNGGWAALATQLKQNYVLAKTNADNIATASAGNVDLQPAATQAAIAELNAAKSFNDFLNTGAQLHKLSSDIYTQLKTNPNLSMSQQLQLSAEQKRLDAAFVEFESFKNDAGLKPFHVPPVYADGKIYSVDGIGLGDALWLNEAGKES